MKRILVREGIPLKTAGIQDTYDEVSLAFQKIGEGLQKYFETTIYQKDKDILMQVMEEDADNQGGKLYNTILDWTSKKFISFRESREGIALLNKIIIEERKLLNRIQILAAEILPDSNGYDRQPGANNLTKDNIKALKDILETHEYNKNHNRYDKGPAELRKLQGNYSVADFF